MYTDFIYIDHCYSNQKKTKQTYQVISGEASQVGLWIQRLLQSHIPEQNKKDT